MATAAEAAEVHEPIVWRVAAPRLATGLAQGVGLYLLSEAQDKKHWPATAPALFAALALILVTVPLVVEGGLGRIRLWTLVGWSVFAAAVLALLAWHDIDAAIWSGLGSSPRLVPDFQVFFFGAAFVFIGHHLVGPADAERRPIAPYAAYFDWTWKDAVQLALSGAFVVVLWISLELGAQLFKLIGIDAFAKLIEKRWFTFPATGLAFAAAVQLTDVRVGLIRGVRTVGLVLLSWLLPVMTLIALAFLAALPFTGLTPLFGAKSAAATMLGASAVLIVLISAAYQEGEATKVPVVLRYAGRAAALALVPMVAIALDALSLRIGQYGLTPARIEALASAIIAGGFAIGYAVAALRRRDRWMAALEPTNRVMAFVAMVAIFVLFTPIADPARLAVDDQVSRLIAGKTAPQAFDYDFLEYRAGRYGQDALKQLARRKGGPRDAVIAQRAGVAAKGEPTNAFVAPPEVVASVFKVYPAGAALPKSFINQDWAHLTPAPGELAPTNTNQPCFGVGPQDCEAYLLDIDGDGVASVLTGPRADLTDAVNLDIFKQSPDGVWRNTGTLNVHCQASIDALRAGRLTLVPKAGKDVELAGRRAQLVIEDTKPCPAATPAPPPAPAKSH
ncbi:MAG: DUF4153 domain-containing protein [Caulobacterales bacterium]